jgi:putative sugar O-methyltransferase
MKEEDFNQRILKIFNIAIKDLKIKKHKSKHWEIYNSRSFKLETLKNFRSSDGLSYGLDDQDNFFSFKIYSDIVRALSEEYILKNSEKENIGNSNSLIQYKNTYIDFNKLIHIHWFKDIEKYVLNKNIKNFCEIGGGFGSLAELIIRNYNIKLLSIDLPEANLLTSYYLKNKFPSKKFFLYDNYLEKKLLTYDDFIKNDIIILPPELIIDKKIKIDFFINTRSMMEMDHEIIDKYFNLIHSHISNDGYFLNINRYEKTTTGSAIRIAEYPYDEFWEVIKSNPSYNQEWIHFLLTQRKFSNYTKNIKNELIKINELGKKYYSKYPILLKFKKTKKFMKKILKIFLFDKILNFIEKLLLSIAKKLKSIK